MKIGLVLPGFSANENDWGIPALYNFVRTLAATNDVHVIALEYPCRRGAYRFFNATVHALGGAHRGKRDAPRLVADALTTLRGENARKSFDLLHAFWVNKAGWIAQLAARFLRVPFIASVAGGELTRLREINYGGQINFVERSTIASVLRGATRVTVGSRYLQRIASQWRDDALIVPLGVDTSFFALHPNPLPQVERKSRLLNVGSLLPVKAQIKLLDALAHIPNACLEIIGGGTLQPELYDSARARGIAARVHFAGEIPHDRLAEKYRAADIVVQSSLHEAQGLAMLEAAACGRAMAGTPVGILPELAERGAAIAANGFEVGDLVEAIDGAMGRQAEMAARAREIAATEFSLDAANKKWIRLYESMV
ncbi:MAG: glycosyltransferase family 4 protein [Chloroflexi bacterium]|nr:glycosyltransferase family 4 protein [Chloroflexota bacterium]